MQNNEPLILSSTIHDKELKMYHRSNIRTITINLLAKNTGENLCKLGLDKHFLRLKA